MSNTVPIRLCNRSSPMLACTGLPFLQDTCFSDLTLILYASFSIMQTIDVAVEVTGPKLAWTLIQTHVTLLLSVSYLQTNWFLFNLPEFPPFSRECQPPQQSPVRLERELNFSSPRKRMKTNVALSQAVALAWPGGVLIFVSLIPFPLVIIWTDSMFLQWILPKVNAGRMR